MEWYLERSEGFDQLDLMLSAFSLVRLKSLHIKFYLNIYKNLKISCCCKSTENYSIFITTLSNWLLKMGD